MKLFKTRFSALAIALAAFTGSSVVANAAADTQYDENDLMLFFQNRSTGTPSGTTGTGMIVGYSLGSTWDVFRRAATPTDPTFGTVISLGNINTILAATYGTDWTTASSSLFAGAAGQNGATSNLSTATKTDAGYGDYARTVYATKKRAGAGVLFQSNSSGFTLPSAAGSQSTLAANIQGSNPTMFNVDSYNLVAENPEASSFAETLVDNYNEFTASHVPATAYGQLTGGVMGSLSDTTYSLRSINNIVVGLDLYRATPVENSSGWQNQIGIEGDIAARAGYYLGTITVSENGDVNFVAVPEPSTSALLALAGAAAFAAARRRKALMKKA